MRIAIDATYSVGRNLSGVGVYSNEILTRLPVAHPKEKFLFCYRPHRFLRSFQSQIAKNARRTLLWKDRPARVDLFHGLNQRIDSTRHRRVVSTFHDLFVITGEYSTPEFRERFTTQAKLAAERSDLIIAVSQFTADQVETLLRVEPSRIRVVHHGAAKLVSTPAPDDARKSNSILFVGAIQKRKNVLRLVQAFEQTKPGWKLILAGSTGFEATEVLDYIRQSRRQADILLPGYVSRETLEALYREASIFAFPSLDEGFGMPVLDAMTRGIPVLTSNGSAMAEVAGNAALLVDPNSVNSIAAGLEKLREDANLRKQLTQSGLARSVNFTWELAAEKTWGVYRELLN